eukprot:UC4_evm1s624
MKNIQASIWIKRDDDANNEDMGHLFVVQNPNPTLHGGISGYGRIEAESTGKIVWNVMALREASDRNPIVYKVGCDLFYSLDGLNQTIDIFPARITVIPDPELHFVYFLEDTIYSDDPFTDKIEAAVPFELAVVIHNAGYG